MNYSRKWKKVFDYIFATLGCFGFLIVFGAVGHMDYMVEIGMDCSIAETIKTASIGFLMIVPMVIRFKDREEGDL